MHASHHIFKQVNKFLSIQSHVTIKYVWKAKEDKCKVRICNFIFSCESDSKSPHQPSTWTVGLRLFRQLLFPRMKLSSSTADKLTHLTLLSGGEGDLLACFAKIPFFFCLNNIFTQENLPLS